MGASPAAQTAFQQIVFTTMSANYQNCYNTVDSDFRSRLAILGEPYPTSEKMWQDLYSRHQNDPEVLAALKRFHDALKLFGVGDPLQVGVVGEITILFNQKAPLLSLQAWANDINLPVNYPNLSGGPDGDIAEFDTLLSLRV